MLHRISKIGNKVALFWISLIIKVLCKIFILVERKIKEKVEIYQFGFIQKSKINVCNWNWIWRYIKNIYKRWFYG